MPQVTDPRLLEKLNTPTPRASQGTVVSDPYKPREQEREDKRLEISQGQLGVSQAAEARQRATLPADVRKAEADAQIASLKAEAAAKEQANAPDPAAARIQQQLQTDSVLGMLNTARSQIGQGWSTGNVFGSKTFQNLPVVGQNSTDLDATLTGISGNIIKDVLAQLKAASATGASGFGSLTEREGQLLQSSVAALQQKQSKDSLLRNLAQVELHYRNALALLNKQDPRDPSVQQQYGIIPEHKDETMPGANPPGGGGTLTSEGKFQPDPSLHGVNATVGAMIQRGDDAASIRDYLNRIRPGMGDKAEGIEAAIQYNRQHPDRAPNINLERQWVPASGVSKVLGDIGQTPYGAATIGAADLLSQGTIDNLTGNPDLARATMAGVKVNNPYSYLLGQVGGGAALGGLGELALGRAGLTGLSGSIASDVGMGAGYGAGSSDDPNSSRVAGALLGAGGGYLGGTIGRGLSRAGGTLVGGISDDVVQALNRAGVRMTPGQIVGGNLKRWEDRLAGFPIVGDAINARRGEGVVDWNRATFRDAIEPIQNAVGGATVDDIGEQGIDALRQLRRQAYRNALDPVTVQADQPFVGDMANVIAAGRNLPEPMRSGMDYTLPTRVGQAFDNAGNLSGNDFQQAIRGLRRDASSVANQPYGYDFGLVSRDAEAALEGLLERQAPGTVEAYRRANEANRYIETLRDAVNRARNSGSKMEQSGVVMPSQLADAASASAKRFGNNAGTTDQPFFDLTRAGQAVLPSAIPDSGTAGRWLIPALAFGAGSGGGYAASEGDTAERAGSSLGTGVTAALLAAAPYSPAARQAVQAALLSPRPQAFRQVGDFMINQDAIAGLLSRPYGIIEATGGR